MSIHLNLMSVIVILFLLCKMVDGYKKGMVKEIISFITLIVMCVVVVLIGTGLKSYVEKEFVSMVVSILLLCILGIAHHLLGLVFFSAKMLTKLPIVHWVDKLLGIAVGALETVLIIWTIYLLIMKMGLGMIGQQILVYTEQSPVLSWLFKYNYLAVWVERIASNISFIEF